MEKTRKEKGNEYIGRIGLQALRDCFQIYNDLGNEGKVLVNKKDGTDMALRLDIETEQVVIDVFRQSGISVQIFSEEHGFIKIGKQPNYTIALDGLDGTNNYRLSSGRSGTMLAVMKGNEPRYRDTIFAGIMTYPQGELYYASKGQARIVTLHESKVAKTSGAVYLTPNLNVFVDVAFDDALDTDIMKRNFVVPLLQSGFSFDDRSASTADHFASIADGSLDITCESTRGVKGNFELPVGYALLRAAGGTIITIDGEKIDDKNYCQWGHDEYIPIVGAASEELAMKFARLLKVKR